MSNLLRRLSGVTEPIAYLNARIGSGSRSGQESTNIGPKAAEALWKKARVLDWQTPQFAACFVARPEPIVAPNVPNVHK